MLRGVYDLKAEQCQACQYKTTDHEKMIRHKEKYCPARTKENETKFTCLIPDGIGKNKGEKRDEHI